MICYVMCPFSGSPFESIAYSFLQTLTIQSTTINTLSLRTFASFQSLKELNMLNMSIRMNTRLLDPVAATLQSLTITESSATANTALNLAAFTSSQLRKLVTVRVRYKIPTLTNDTFSGSENLVILHLASCQIERIEPNTFDNLIHLRLLDLDDNRLTTIPNDLFADLLPSYTLYIQLRNNPWSCDCDACYLQTSLDEYFYSFRIENNWCDNQDYCDARTCSSSSSTTSTTTIEPTTSMPSGSAPNTEVLASCMLDNDGPVLLVDVIKVTLRERSIRIRDNYDGTVDVTINTKPVDKTILIWFDDTDQQCSSKLTDSSGNSDICPPSYGMGDGSTMVTRTIRVPVSEYVPYTFCVMTDHHMEFLVSPFNCVSYAIRPQPKLTDGGDSWFDDDAKTFTMVMLIIGLVLIFVFGMILGFVLMRRYPLCGLRRCLDAGASRQTPKSSNR